MPVAATQPNSILRASEWLVALATGPLATSIAVIAIALVGFAMLTGRINWRRGATGPSEIVVAEKSNPAAPPAPDAQDPYSGASIIR